MRRSTMYHGALLLMASALLATTARASLSAFGPTNFSRQSSASTGYDRDSYSAPKRDWSAKMALGGGLSQLLRDSRLAGSTEVTDNAFQLNLVVTAERVLAGPLRAESGLGVGMQFVSLGAQGNTSFTARYLEIPMALRLYFTRQLSLGAGGFAMIPVDDLNGAPAAMRLMSTNLGLLASVRWNIPASRLADWIVEVNVQRGLTHVGDAGSNPNHVRNVGALFGLSARF